MAFLDWLYWQEGHALPPEGDSPYSRPEEITVLEGGAGFDPERAVEILQVKRLPWELHDSDLYRSDWLSGGVIFPEGEYVVRMKVNIQPAQGMPDGLEYPWPYFGWIYALERRAHDHGILSRAPITWYPFWHYGNSDMGPRSTVVNTWMGMGFNDSDWESFYDQYGPALAFKVKGDIRIAAIIARITWVWTDESIPDWYAYLEAQANVNGFGFRPEPHRGYITFGTDGPH